MKKIILFLAFLTCGFLTFSQSGIPEPTHTLTPSKFKPGNWNMLGAWDSTNACYADTLGYYMEGDTVKIWSNKILWINGNTIQPNLWKLTTNKLEPVISTNYINTDSSYYIKGVDFIRYYPDPYFSMAIGDGAMSNDTMGSHNIAIGENSLYSNTTGSYNTSNGAESLFSNTTGNGNIANGIQSLYSNTEGNYNVANGAASLYSNTTGGENIANGFQSLFNNTTGSGNISIGYQSLYSNTTGINNIAIGYKSGQYADTAASGLLWIGEGDSNTAIIYGYHGASIKRLRLNADVYLKNKLSFPIFSATIADTLTPTEAELTTAIGLTPAEAGSGGSFVVKSTSGCLYDIISDGINYYCIKRKKLW